MLQVYASFLWCSKNNVKKLENQDVAIGGMPWASPSLWFEPFLDNYQFGLPSFRVKNLNHKY
jgi:hypothetical protein